MVRAFMCACLLGAVFVAPAAAVRPVMERVPVADNFLDEGLTELCGFDVWVTGTGHITFRLMTDNDGNPVREVNNFAILVTYSSEFGSVSTVDVGPDRVTYNDDGSLDIFITGNPQSLTAPGEGRVWANSGWIHIRLTFDENGDATVEFIDSAGLKTEGEQAPILCELLGPA
jgi:hypothetical protein